MEVTHPIRPPFPLANVHQNPGLANMEIFGGLQAKSVFLGHAGRGQFAGRQNQRTTGWFAAAFDLKSAHRLPSGRRFALRPPCRCLRSPGPMDQSRRRPAQGNDASSTRRGRRPLTATDHPGVATENACLRPHRFLAIVTDGTPFAYSGVTTLCHRCVGSYYRALLLFLVCSLGACCDGKRNLTDAADRPLKVLVGFVVEHRVAGPPLIEHPMNGCFDEQGRLLLTEAAGLNLKADELLRRLPNSIKRLEDVNGDGRFDKAEVFADKMTFPAAGFAPGTTVPFSLRLIPACGESTATAGRTAIVGEFGSSGNAADLHGPNLGPDGSLYWCDGRNGHEFRSPTARCQGLAAAIFRCRPDGSQWRSRVRRRHGQSGRGRLHPGRRAPRGGDIVLDSPRATTPSVCPRRGCLSLSRVSVPGISHHGRADASTGDSAGSLPPDSSLSRRCVRARNTAIIFSAQFNPHRMPRHILETARGRLPRPDRGFCHLGRPGFSSDWRRRGRRRQPDRH